MSPFASFVKKIRDNRKIRQKQMAILLGYEPSYISALERGEKGPPRNDFIQRFIRGMELDELEQQELAQALKASRRQFSLPARASEQEYALLHQLEPQLGNLHPLQIQLMQLVLSIPGVFSGGGQPVHCGRFDLSLGEQEVPRM